MGGVLILGIILVCLSRGIDLMRRDEGRQPVFAWLSMVLGILFIFIGLWGICQTN